MNLSAELLAQVREGMKPTGLDRVISHLAPAWGMKRMEARATMFALGGGSWAGGLRATPELKNWNPLASSPDDEQRYDRPWLLARSADLERNDALAGGAIEEQVLSVVGTGLSVHSEPMRNILGWSQDQAVEWAEDVKARFNLWAGDARECDIARRRNFYQAQSLAFRAVCSRGDCYTLLPRRRHPGTTWALKFQVIEGDRLLTPPGHRDGERLAAGGILSQGVETDELGGITRYWFCKKHPTSALSSLSLADFVPMDAWDSGGQRLVLPLMHENRLDLRRGYPLLAPVITTLKQMSRLSDAELAAAVVTSFFAVVIKKTGTGPGPLGGSVTRDTNGQGFAELGPAIVADLRPGEEIENVQPTRPNAAFDPFWKSLLGQIAMRLQIPPEVLLKKFDSSYTAARGALLQYWKFVTVERENLLAPNFCQPLFEAWMAEDVANGRIKAPGFFKSPLLRAAYTSAKWVGDNPPILDPLKEVLAAQELINYGLSTHAEQTMRLGNGDFEANTERLGRELRLQDEAGIQGSAKVAPPPAPFKDPFQDPNQDANEPTPQQQKADQEAKRAFLVRLAEDAHEDSLAIRKEMALLAARPIQVEVQAAQPVVIPAPIVHSQLVTPARLGRTVELKRDAEGHVTGAVIEEEPTK